MMDFEEAQKRDAQEREAVENMIMLGLREDMIQKFKTNGTLYCSEEGFDPEKLTAKERKMVKDFEKRTGNLVYHVIKGDMVFDSRYFLIFVPCRVEEWAQYRKGTSLGMLITYVVNKDRPVDNGYEICWVTLGGGKLNRIL